MLKSRAKAKAKRKGQTQRRLDVQFRALKNIKLHIYIEELLSTSVSARPLPSFVCPLKPTFVARRELGLGHHNSLRPVSGESFRASPVKTLGFPSPTGSMFVVFGCFPSSI